MSKAGWAVGGSGVLTMGSVVPSPEDMVCVIPAHVILLGEALAPIAPGARQALTHTEPSSGQAFDPLGDTSRHLGVIQQALKRLKPRLDELMTDVIHKEGASAIDAGRVAGRLEQVISEFVDGYLDAKASPADGEASEAKRLILGVYRHHLTEICEWLEELVAVINHPATALHKRGMAADSSPQLTVALNLTTPPEMAQLEALASSFGRAVEVSGEAPCRDEDPSPPSPGLLETIGALAFGAGVAEAILGSRHE